MQRCTKDTVKSVPSMSGAGKSKEHDMTYIIVAFSSRALAMQAQQIFARRGIPVTVINTPREADGSCGLSVRADVRYRASVMQTISSTVLRSGVKAVILMGYDQFGRKIVERI